MKVLVGESLLASALIAYGCGQIHREDALHRWRQVCLDAGIQCLEAFSAGDFLSPLPPLAAQSAWMSTFPQFQENHLSVCLSHKWPLIIDPHDLAAALQPAR